MGRSKVSSKRNSAKKPASRTITRRKPPTPPQGGTGGTNGGRLTVAANEFDPKQMAQLLVNSALSSRVEFAHALGMQFGTDRDIYKSAGYPEQVEFGKYDGMYRRNDIAKRIVNAFPDATWRGNPVVLENDDDDQTEFEEAWTTLVKERRVWHYLRKVDRVSGIGQYGVLLLGFNDDGSLETEVSPGSASDLLFMQTYKQNNAVIKTFETSPSSERNGQPLTYELQVKNLDLSKESQATVKTPVHWSRVIHVAEDAQENDYEGTPRLEVVLNRLYDLEKVMAGGAENFWRSGFPGLNLNMDALAKELTTTQKTALDEEIKQYMHGLTRVLRTRGIEANELAQTVSDPTKHVDAIIKLISGATGIPQRILTGSERGELASSSDQDNWKERVDERRETFAEPWILREFIDRLIVAGVLPEVDEYRIDWPDMDQLSKIDEANILKTQTEAMAKYVASGVDHAIPLFFYLTLFMGLDQDKVESMMKQLEEEAEDEFEEEERRSEQDFERQRELKRTAPNTPPVPDEGGD